MGRTELPPFGVLDYLTGTRASINVFFYYFASKVPILLHYWHSGISCGELSGGRQTSVVHLKLRKCSKVDPAEDALDLLVKTVETVELRRLTV